MSGHLAHQEQAHTLGDALHFVSRFITKPGSVGSLWPSSRDLGLAMVAELKLEPGDVVVEYGPGSGPFTSVLKEWMPRGTEYLGIEFDPELHRTLVRRFPGMRFHLGSAEYTPAILGQYGLERARVIISGLPFSIMPPELQHRILEATSDALHEGGDFPDLHLPFLLPQPGIKPLPQDAESAFSGAPHGQNGDEKLPACEGPKLLGTAKTGIKE